MNPQLLSPIWQDFHTQSIIDFLSTLIIDRVDFQMCQIAAAGFVEIDRWIG